MRQGLPGVSEALVSRTFSHGGIDEVCLIAPSTPGGIDDPQLASLRAELRTSFGAQLVRENRFGLVDGLGTTGVSGDHWPVTALTRGAQIARPPAAICMQAINGTKTSTIRSGGRVVGVTFEDAYARYALLGDLQPERADVSRGEQTRQVFDRLERALDRAGMGFSNVIRTWFYNDHILDWYGEFNAVRSAFFKERGVFDRLVPASTGVGLGNTAGCALVAEAFAVKPKDPCVRIRAVPSPLQCPALDYGSSFSRGVEFAAPDHRRLLVSGTASIATDGRNLHVGDLRKQIAFTLQVVKAILDSRGMDWSHTSRAVAYFKRAEDMGALATLPGNPLQGLPVALVHADICRDELLFELELDAVRLAF